MARAGYLPAHRASQAEIERAAPMRQEPLHIQALWTGHAPCAPQTHAAGAQEIQLPLACELRRQFRRAGGHRRTGIEHPCCCQDLVLDVPHANPLAVHLAARLHESVRVLGACRGDNVAPLAHHGEPPDHTTGRPLRQCANPRLHHAGQSLAGRATPTQLATPPAIVPPHQHCQGQGPVLDLLRARRATAPELARLAPTTGRSHRHQVRKKQGRLNHQTSR